MPYKVKNLVSMDDTKLMEIVYKLLEKIDFKYNYLSNIHMYDSSVVKILKIYINNMSKNVKEFTEEDLILKVKAILLECIRNDFNDLKSALRITNEFVLNNIKVSESRNKNIKEFDKILYFFRAIGYEPTSDFILEVVSNGEALNNLIEKIYEQSNISEEKTLNNSFNNQLVEFIEAYCAINNIELDQDNNEISNVKLGDSISMYFKNLKQPFATVEEEREAAKRIREGDKKAKNEFIERNLKLTISVAKKYIGKGMDLADLIQEGNIGLMKAVDKFDVNRGCKFSTYAIWWIKQSIRRAISDQSKMIRIPVHASERVTKIKLAQATLFERLQRNPTLHELSEELGMTEREITEAIRADQTLVSLDATINDDDDTTLKDFIKDEYGEDPEDVAIKKTLREDIFSALNNLTYRERKIIIERFGLDGGAVKTLEALGQELNVTRERIRQIESKTIRKLRHQASIKSHIPKI